ncbi:protealysin inhibitor emfourin [Streptomyces sp. NPDC058751]|uniref:protealysin inhibitor emfourin n=1 Tax=Streptomyces sp. NPDC058751 TaxID=3346623 RepID=UPI0036B551E5
MPEETPGRVRVILEMKVTWEVHGGQAAAVRLGLPPKALDSDTLPENAAGELERLVAAAVPETEEERPSRARDAMSYTITVEDGGRSTAPTRSDATMSPAFAALPGRLEEHVAQR